MKKLLTIKRIAYRLVEQQQICWCLQTKHPSPVLPQNPCNGRPASSGPRSASQPSLCAGGELEAAVEVTRRQNLSVTEQVLEATSAVQFCLQL